MKIKSQLESKEQTNFIHFNLRIHNEITMEPNLEA